MDAGCLLLGVFLDGFGSVYFGVLLLPELLSQVEVPQFFLETVGWPDEEGYFGADGAEVVEGEGLLGIFKLSVQLWEEVREESLLLAAGVAVPRCLYDVLLSDAFVSVGVQPVKHKLQH